jgi:anti-sigma factor ChrR (cupin superfamily)
MSQAKKTVLVRDETSGLRMEIQELAPNSVFGKHRHSDFEWVYILEGELKDEFGTYPAGTFKLNPKDSIHQSRTTIGCKLLLVTRAEHIPVE